LKINGHTNSNESKEHIQLGRSHPKPVAIPNQNCDLAEFLGIYFGDGSATENPPAVTVSLSYSKEKEYAFFVRKLLQEVFGTDVGIVEHKKADNIQVRIYRITLVRFLRGNIKRDLGMPNWIKSNSSFLCSFIRGLMDCEASVYRVEKGKKRIRIELKMRNKKLLEDMNNALLSLGYHSLIYLERNRLAIARQEEVDRYFKEIGSHNPKHTKRYLSLREPFSDAPVV
jgi:intein/homing endonuclease